MAGNQWEVVGGKTKKVKNKSKDKVVEKATLDAISGPISQEKTIYSYLAEKDEVQEQNKPKEKETLTTNKGNNPSKKKKVDKKAAVIKRSLEDAITELTETNIKSHLTAVEALLPNNHLLWLKDLTAYLNLKLDVALEDLTFSNKLPGYPSSLLSKKVSQQLVKLLTKCTNQELKKFHEICLQEMVKDILKGMHTVGYRIMLQLLAQEVPEVVLKNISKCSDLCNAHQNRQNICLSILWAAGQVGVKDIGAASRVWMNLMFPLIGTKNCTLYAVEYLEKLVNDAHGCNQSIFGVRDLFPILDFVYSKDLVKSVQKRLLNLYPTLKALSYGSLPETGLRNYFPSYLRRLESTCPQLLKNELLDSLTLCLEKDERCCTVWQQLYEDHLLQSKVLLEHLNSLSKPKLECLPRRSFRNAISEFQKKDPKSQVLSELQSKLSPGFLVTLCKMLLPVVILVALIVIPYSLLDANQSQMLNAKLLYYGIEFQKRILAFLEWVTSGISSLLVSTSKRYFPVVSKWMTLNVLPVLQEVEKQFVLHGTWMWVKGAEAVTVLSRAIFAALIYLITCMNAFVAYIESSPKAMFALEAASQLVVNLKNNVMHVYQLAKQYILS